MPGGRYIGTITPKQDLFRQKLGVDMPAEYLNKIVRYIHTELYHHSSKPIRNKAIRRTKKAFLNAPTESRVNGLVGIVADWDIRKINLERFEQGIVRRYERLVESGARNIIEEPVYREDIYGPLIEDE